MKLWFNYLILTLWVFPLAGEELTLEHVWACVQANHEDVKRLNLENYQASLDVRQTLLTLLPSIGASASLIYSRESKEVDGSRIVPKTFREGTLSASQSLVDLRLRPSYLSAKYAKEATCHHTEFELYEVLYLASEIYLALLQSEELLRVSEHQLNLAEQQHGVAKERYDAGEVPVSDLLRTEEEVNRAQRTIHDIQSDVLIHQEQLSNMVGWEISGCRLVTPQMQEEETACVEKLVDQALCRREDLKSTAAAIKASRQVVRSLKRTNWPRVDALGQYTLASPETLSFDNSSWSAGLWLNIPLFDQGMNWNNVKNAKAELSKQQLLYERMAKDLRVRVKSVYYELASAKSNFSLLEKDLEIAQENYTILSERYGKGETSNIDLMDSLGAYIAAQAHHASARYNLILLGLKLKKETGFFQELLKTRCG